MTTTTIPSTPMVDLYELTPEQIPLLAWGSPVAVTYRGEIIVAGKLQSLTRVEGYWTAYIEPFDGGPLHRVDEIDLGRRKIALLLSPMVAPAAIRETWLQRHVLSPILSATLAVLRIFGARRGRHHD